ncbi:MAG: hypothetical protein J6D37_05165, partial [Clostridia bacterium]|nr:hypothetical protein [Clostridia bacterium]
FALTPAAPLPTNLLLRKTFAGALNFNTTHFAQTDRFLSVCCFLRRFLLFPKNFLRNFFGSPKRQQGAFSKDCPLGQSFALTPAAPLPTNLLLRKTFAGALNFDTT